MGHVQESQPMATGLWEPDTMTNTEAFLQDNEFPENKTGHPKDVFQDFSLPGSFGHQDESFWVQDRMSHQILAADQLNSPPPRNREDHLSLATAKSLDASQPSESTIASALQVIRSLVNSNMRGTVVCSSCQRKLVDNVDWDAVRKLLPRSPESEQESAWSSSAPTPSSSELLRRSRSSSIVRRESDDLGHWDRPRDKSLASSQDSLTPHIRPDTLSGTLPYRPLPMHHGPPSNFDGISPLPSKVWDHRFNALVHETGSGPSELPANEHSYRHPHPSAWSTASALMHDTHCLSTTISGRASTSSECLQRDYGATSDNSGIAQLISCVEGLREALDKLTAQSIR